MALAFSTDDIISFLILLAIVMLAIIITDWIALTFSINITGAYLISVVIVALILSLVAATIEGIASELDNMVGDAVNFTQAVPILGFIVGVYGVKFMLNRPYKGGTRKEDRTWPHSIWFTFFVFVVYYIMQGVIQYVADNM
ncbi:MAG: hypothetical protein KAR35_02495 [Candidatus Heimdallarchaeota archaeon]|nr:hypothetical protein [Candidatus Heimdallarchaeota archaeon]MCK5048224.1 hypothetical protein [Candidatus Heimdallarchaeota archaeon]